MEIKNWLAIGISLLALVVSIGSATFSIKQYRLNVDRDAREREARLPTFDPGLAALREGRLWGLTLGILNRSDVKLTFDFMAIEGLEGARLALSDGKGGHLNPVGALPKIIPNGVDPHASAVWDGYILIDDQAPGGKGKPVSLVYAFRLIDAPDIQIERKSTLILP